jgi:hypothetical protein
MKEKILSVLRKPGVIPTSVGVISVASGFSVAWYIQNRRWSQLVMQLIEKDEQHTAVVEEMSRRVDAATDMFDERLTELRDPRKFFAVPVNPNTEIEDETLSEPMQRLVEAVTTPVTPVIEQLEAIAEEYSASVVRNIFSTEDDEWDFEVELAGREGKSIYVIHREEFFQREAEGYDQMTITYYAGDDVPTDDHDKAIPNHKKVFGEMLFGHGSGDPNVVYIRNDDRRAEYEIVRHEGSYSVEVLGTDVADMMEADDIRHARSPRRFREE